MRQRMPEQACKFQGMLETLFQKLFTGGWQGESIQHSEKAIAQKTYKIYTPPC
jgi:hypothetical protein